MVSEELPDPSQEEPGPLPDLDPVLMPGPSPETDPLLLDENPSTEELLAKMDEVVKQGQESVEKFEALMEARGVPDDMGTEVLTDPNAPARRLVFGVLINELTNLDERVEQVAEDLEKEADSASRPSAVARAVGNRYRI